MKIARYTYDSVWDKDFDATFNTQESLVLIFASAKKEIVQEPLKELVDFFSNASIIGASTAGEIAQGELLDESIVVVVMQFYSTSVKVVSEALHAEKSSYENGVSIAKKLYKEDLKAVFVLSDGLNTNGSKLTKGLASEFSNNVVVTGGLAGDDHHFKKTFVIAEGKFVEGFVSAVGLYGDKIHVGYASGSGWDSLGITRRITKSKDNILYELDSQPALDVYKRYLGKRAAELPAVGIHFPIELSASSGALESTIRTILGIDEDEKSIIFAGDVPEGNYATLMRANYDRLIDGATDAAEKVSLSEYKGEELVSIAVSCVGRKLVLKQRIEEELEAILDVLPVNTQQIGFYSYGEISPMHSGICDLHNETMTLTLLWEEDA